MRDVITPEEFERGAVKSEIFEKTERRMEVAELKEIYSREYLLKNGSCTLEEYDSIPASTERADRLERARDWVILRNQVVGAEVDYNFKEKGGRNE